MNKRLAILCALAIGVGCGGGTSSNDAGNGGDDTGGGGNDAGADNDAACVAGDGGVPTYPALAVPTGDTLDLSCRGHATVPAGGAATMGTLTVHELLSASTPITSTNIDIWTNDMIGTGACAAPNCMTEMTDAMNGVTPIFSAPLGAWLAFHMQTSSATAEVLAYNMPWNPTMGTMTTDGVAMSTIGTTSALLGRTYSTTLGAISGQVSDCMGNALANAEARVYMGTTRIMSGPSCDRMSPRITGIEVPTPTRNTLTGPAGQFVGADVPPADNYRVEIWGMQPGMSAAQLIGCEEGRVVAGGITILSIGPLRSDYAAGSGCAMAAAANP